MTTSHCINDSHAPCNAGQYAMCRECHHNPRELSLGSIHPSQDFILDIRRRLLIAALWCTTDCEMRDDIAKMAASGRKIEIIIREAR